MKRARALLITLLMFVITFTIVGCSKATIEKPADTNLEFWITENVDNIDFSVYQEKYGWMGAKEYYGIGYEPTSNEDREQIEPEYYVKYLVTNYPDYSSKHKAVTRISITDPDIEFYGLSLASSMEDITAKMDELGYHVEMTGDMINASKENVTFIFTHELITIIAEVTNKSGIVF